MPGKTTAETCIDCKEAPPVLTVRKRDLCQDCYSSYVGTKVRRRLAKYRAKNVPKDQHLKLLLPLSYGVSSFTLLHIVDEILEKQARSAFDIAVLHVNPPTTEASTEPFSSQLGKVRETYPRHTYTEIPLHSVFQYGVDINNIVAEYGISGNIEDPAKSQQERLDLFTSSFTTATSRTDIEGILLSRLIVGFAKHHKYDGILWGDSDSRLAAKALANVAKGRGFSAPWEICDGLSPWGIQFNFPLRDLYKTELVQYASLMMPSLSPIIDSEPPILENVSNKNMSIEALMTQYVETQGEKYPGVMANIVRTIDKLRPPPADVGVQCLLCGMPVEGVEAFNGDLPSDLREIAEKTSNTQVTCYGCARSCSDIKQRNAAS